MIWLVGVGLGVVGFYLAGVSGKADVERDRVRLNTKSDRTILLYVVSWLFVVGTIGAFIPIFFHLLDRTCSVEAFGGATLDVSRWTIVQAEQVVVPVDSTLKTAVAYLGIQAENFQHSRRVVDLMQEQLTRIKEYNEDLQWYRKTSWARWLLYPVPWPDAKFDLIRVAR